MPSNEYKQSSFNMVIIAGKLTRDPELRYLESGTPVCKYGIANTEHFKDKAGNKQEKTIFINVTVWGASGEWVGEHIKKGYPVMVQGKLVMDEWDDKGTGQKRTAISISAFKVEQCTWDNSRAGGGKQGDQREIEEPESQSDIPF